MVTVTLNFNKKIELSLEFKVLVDFILRLIDETIL